MYREGVAALYPQRAWLAYAFGEIWCQRPIDGPKTAVERPELPVRRGRTSPLGVGVADQLVFD